MPKTLTLGVPEMWAYDGKVRTVKWDLLDKDRKGYRISWIEKAFDTLKPECIAFPIDYNRRGTPWLDYRGHAVSHNPDAVLALIDVMKQLRKKYGYEYNTEVEIQLLPGEVVADGNR